MSKSKGEKSTVMLENNKNETLEPATEPRTKSPSKCSLKKKKEPKTKEVKVKEPKTKEPKTTEVKVKEVKVKEVKVKESKTKEVKVKEPKTTEDKTQTENVESSRKQLSKLIGIELPIPRIRKQLDKFGVNLLYTNVCNELKEHVNDNLETLVLSDAARKLFDEACVELNKRAEKSEDKSNYVPTVSSCIEFISKKRFRFSSEASVVMTTVLNYVLTHVIKSSILGTQKRSENKVSVVEVENNSDVEYLLRKLPVLGVDYSETS